MGTRRSATGGCSGRVRRRGRLLATGRYWAIPLIAALVWVTLGLNYALKRGVRACASARAPWTRAADHARPPRPSFPSSHAAMAAAGAVALSVECVCPRSPLFATLAVLMAASRVHLGVHHVSDVVVGLAVGACTGAAFALLAA